MKTKIHMPMGMYSAFKQPYSIYMRRARCVFGLLNTADGEKTRWFGIALRVPAIEVGVYDSELWQSRRMACTYSDE